jgi:glycosyltransferase involved in cell wall biosynthesis
MLIFSCSLDSSIERAIVQGSVNEHRERYSMFNRFDEVVLLTQDTKKFDVLGKVSQIPCARSNIKLIQLSLEKFKPFKWLYVYASSFMWLVKNRKKVNLVITENADSPTPCLFSLLFKVPFVIHYHYDVSSQVSTINKQPIEGLMLLFLEKLCFKRAASVWVTAPSLGEKAKTLGAKKVTLVPNWIEIDKSPASQLQEFPKTGKENIILFVGRLHPVKRVNLLVEAFDEFLKINKNASLVILGDGPERQQLAAQVNNLKLADKVEFLGFQSHNKVLEIMRQSNALVLPSVMEGNPRVLIEAMITGLPIIGTNVPGIRDIIQHKKTGYLIEKATPDELCSAINYVLTNKKRSLEIAQRAQEFAKKEFSKVQVLIRIEEDLSSIVPIYRKTRCVD